MKKINSPIAEKYLLTIDEAATHFNIGTQRLRTLAKEIPSCFIMIGTRTMIKRAKFEKYLDSVEVL